MPKSEGSFDDVSRIEGFIWLSIIGGIFACLIGVGTGVLYLIGVI
jgi:hypothetical protein